MDPSSQVMLGIEQQTSPINYRLLDDLVLDYIRFQVPIQPGEYADGNATAWAAIAKVQLLAANGDIPAAVAAVKRIGPDILDEDSRLLFKLKRQQFIEYLRTGKPDDHQEAIGFLRKELAPLALDAYPEAYGELKRCLMTLVFQDGGAETPVTPEWSLETRVKLAAQLARTLRQAECVHDNRLSLILRYLALTYEALEQSFPGLQSTEVASVGPAVARLGVQLQHRQPAPTPLEVFSLSPEVQMLMNQIPKADYQRLKNAVGISREEAVDSLRHADSSLETAFLFELSALPINRDMLDALVAEYASTRGLLEQTSIGGDDATYSPPRQENGAEAMAVDEENLQLRERRESALGTSPSRSRPNTGWQHLGRDGGDISADFKRQASCSPPKKVARCRGHSPGSSENVDSPSLQINGGLQSSCSPKAPDRDTLLAVRQLVETGDFSEAIAAVRQLDSGFFEAHPRLLFELHVCRFQALLDAGDTKGALALARSKLSGISNAHPGLQPALKATLGRLLPGIATQPPPSLTSLAFALEEALSEALCIRDPQLVSLLKALLAAHTEWFKLQRCKDHLEHFLGIRELKHAPAAAALAAPGSQPSKLPNCGASDAEGSLPADEASPFDEDLVTDAMEVTNLGRTDVLTMLQDVGGNLEALLENLFS